MASAKRHFKFAAVWVVSILVVGALGFTAWFAYHSEQVADQTLRSANKVSNDVPKLPQITSFEDCKKAGGSKLLQTYPEQCVTTAGKTFTDASQKYLVIKEWGVKIPLSEGDSSAYYTIDSAIKQSATNPTNLTIYSTKTDALVGPTGLSCKGEYVAYLLRLPKDDPSWQPSISVDDGNVAPVYGQRVTIGGYKYAIATHKEYGPDCFETTKSGSYNPDPTISEKFGTVVTVFASDFKKITDD